MLDPLGEGVLFWLFLVWSNKDVDREVLFSFCLKTVAQFSKSSFGYICFLIQ